MNYRIVVYPCDEGGFVAEIPALPGCLAQGETL
ncbi:MAG: type II toxin-antitoxin system HicB family antitoxin [Gloeotrichia echinulata IR180]|nr:type II toxin-antitoxin system HicB family antitoxin [Gloeotrichia echinulata DEX184]